MQSKYFRVSALVLELRMLIFFQSEKKSFNESAIRLSGRADDSHQHAAAGIAINVSVGVYLL